MPGITGKRVNIVLKELGTLPRLPGSLCLYTNGKVYSTDFHLCNSFPTFSTAPAASQDTITGVLGQSVTLPCRHPSWSRHRNSMCWGKGACPNSKCNEELVHTDGTKMISRKSTKYALLGIVWRGDVSLTITNSNQGDSGVYCCRIEVPGWFNDIKKTVRLELSRGEERTGVSSEEEFRGLW